MKNLKLLYFSPTDTTKIIVENIAAGLEMKCEYYNITLAQNRIEIPKFEKDDLLILGLPVYGGRIPIILEEYLLKLNGNGASAIPVAIYGNRDYDDCLLEMADLLKQTNFKLESAAAFIGEHSFTKLLATNRPDSNDIKIAHDFGAKTKKLIESSNINGELKIKGNFPYKERSVAKPMAPTVNSNCTVCKICLNTCPVNAINFDKVIIADENKCIKCNSCVKKCPQNAINFDERLDAAKTWLVDSFGDIRREPELFFKK